MPLETQFHGRARVTNIARQDAYIASMLDTNEARHHPKTAALATQLEARGCTADHTQLSSDTFEECFEPCTARDPQSDITIESQRLQPTHNEAELRLPSPAMC